MRHVQRRQLVTLVLVSATSACVGGDLATLDELDPSSHSAETGGRETGGDDESDEAITWTQVSVGLYTACGVLSTGDLRCWGRDWDEDRVVSGAPEGVFLSVSVGGAFACGLDTSQYPVCWGRDTYGTVSDTPHFQLSSLEAGNSHICGVDLYSGALSCWGHAEYGETTAPLEEGFQAVSAGHAYTCAIASDDTLTCWGLVGVDGDVEIASVPSGSFTSLSAGNDHACAISEAGQISCWGDEPTLGYGVLDPPAGVFTAVSADHMDSCAIDLEGQLACWGYGHLSEPPEGVWSAVSRGYDTACAISVDGSITCWGDDEYGQATPPHLDDGG